MIVDSIDNMHNSYRWTTALLVFTCMTLGLAGCGKSITLSELSATDQSLAGPAITETPVPPTVSAQGALQMMVTQTAQAQDILASQVALQMMVTQTAQDILASQAAQAQEIQSTQTAQGESILLAETSQAQTLVNAQVLQTNQAAAAMTSFPMTATSYASTQAAGVVQEYDREQQAFLNRIVDPLIPILATLVLVLFIVFILVVYRRYMAIPFSRRPRFGRRAVNPARLILEGRVLEDLVSRHQPPTASERPPVTPIEQPVENKIHVEIVDPADPPIIQWIAEAEQKLIDDGKEPL